METIKYEEERQRFQERLKNLNGYCENLDDGLNYRIKITNPNNGECIEHKFSVSELTDNWTVNRILDELLHVNGITE